MRYAVLDLYDGDAEVLVRTDLLSVVLSTAAERIDDTDGECLIMVQDIRSYDLIPLSAFRRMIKND